MKIVGNRASVAFTHLGGGLMAKDGELRGFTIAGTDKNFVPAKAEIHGGEVIVSSETGRATHRRPLRLGKGTRREPIQ